MGRGQVVKSKIYRLSDAELRFDFVSGDWIPGLGILVLKESRICN